MTPASSDFSDELEEPVGAHGADRREMQTKNEDREQENAAPEPRHSNEGPHSKTHQALNQQIHDNTGSCLSIVRWHFAGECLDRLRCGSDEAFPLQMQNNFLCCFFWR